MRTALISVIVFCCLTASAQTETWSWGGKIAFHCARLQITSASAPSRWSSIQTTPAFGLYFRSPEVKPTLFEIQSGYEITGANKELYFPTASMDWVRIYDRYVTLPISAMAYRHLFFSEKLWIGAGIKGQYVIKANTRNNNPLPGGTPGLIFEPEVKKFFAGVSAELMLSGRFADVSVCGSYALSALIAGQGIKVVPVTAAITVKKRLVAGGRNGEF